MAQTRIRLDKQIQKATKANQFPLSDVNGELQFADIEAIIKTGETQTTLNSVEVTGGTLIIKYTPENGIQQVVSTPLNFSQTDINVSDAKLENPSSGVYRLIISETDGSTYPVDLSALLAVVCQNTEYAIIEGNGTPQNPLKIEFTSKFWNDQVRKLDDLDDVVIDDIRLNDEVDKKGTVVLVFDKEESVWVPCSIHTLEDFKEQTEVFEELTEGRTVSLSVPFERVEMNSIKVYRNGLRQLPVTDYNYEGDGKSIGFSEPFSDKHPESVVIDYRLLLEIPS